MFAHSYSSRQARTCWRNIVRSAKQYSHQMMTEGHSRELLISESDWKSITSGRSRSSKTTRTRSRWSWFQELPGLDARLSADNDGRGSPKLADISWSGNLVRCCADSWTSGHSACSGGGLKAYERKMDMAATVLCGFCPPFCTVL